MTNLSRVTGKIFGENATATGSNPEIGQFGSALAGTYNGTTDVATIQRLDAWGQGWAGAVTPDTNFPPLPEMTGVQKVNSYQNAYVLQKGIAEYDSSTIYYAKTSYCQINGAVYQSLTDENQGNDPTTDTTNWQFVGIGGDSIGSETEPVYVNNGAINTTGYSIANDRFDGQWVASTKELSTATAVGTYEIDLSDYLPDDNYNYVIQVIHVWYDAGDDAGKVYQWTDLMPNPKDETDTTKQWGLQTGNKYDRHESWVTHLKVGTGRMYYYYIPQGVSTHYCWVISYRRIGTNI